MRVAIGLIVVGVIAAGVLIGRPADAQDGQDLTARVSALEARVATLEAAVAPVGTAVVATTAGDAITLQGQGDRVSEPIPLHQGLVVLDVLAEGPREEIDVKVYGEDGDELFGLYIYEYSPYAGSAADDVDEAGNYFVAVEHSGSWSITIRQPA